MSHCFICLYIQDGSVTTDISRAVKEAKKNITFKKDKSAIVHVGLGKVINTSSYLCSCYMLFTI